MISYVIDCNSVIKIKILKQLKILKSKVQNVNANVIIIIIIIIIII